MWSASAIAPTPLKASEVPTTAILGLRAKTPPSRASPHPAEACGGGAAVLVGSDRRGLGRTCGSRRVPLPGWLACRPTRGSETCHDAAAFGFRGARRACAVRGRVHRPAVSQRLRSRAAAHRPGPCFLDAAPRVPYRLDSTTRPDVAAVRLRHQGLLRRLRRAVGALREG